MDTAMSLAYAVQNDPNLLVPVTSLTDQAQMALLALGEAMKSVPEGPFKDFVNNNIIYSVEVLGGVTDGMLIGDDVHSLSKGSPLIDVGTDSIVYLRHSITPLVGGIYYVGSASNAYNRIGQHIASMGGSRPKESIHDKLDSLGGDIGFSQVYRSANYYNIAVKAMPEYNLSGGELWILRALTEFVPRVLEQSIIIEYSPSLNDSERPVLFNYNHWDASLLGQSMRISDSAIPVQIRNADTGEILASKVPSIVTVCVVLGIKRSVVERLLKTSGVIYSTRFNCNITISVVDTGVVLNQYSPLTLPGGPLTSLADHTVWAFESDKVSFEGPFRSFSEASRYLNPTGTNNNLTPSGMRKAVSHMCNCNIPVHTEIGAYYIACNPNTRPTNLPYTSPMHPIYGKPMPKTPFDK